MPLRIRYVRNETHFERGASRQNALIAFRGSPACRLQFAPFSNAKPSGSCPFPAAVGQSPDEMSKGAFRYRNLWSRIFARNATIFSDGDEARSFLQNRQRHGPALQTDERRAPADRGIPAAGDFFGFEWLDTHSLTAEALTVVVAFVTPASRLDRLGEERSDVQRSLMTLLSRDLWAAQNHI